MTLKFSDTFYGVQSLTRLEERFCKQQFHYSCNAFYNCQISRSHWWTRPSGYESILDWISGVLVSAGSPSKSTSSSEYDHRMDCGRIRCNIRGISTLVKNHSTLSCLGLSQGSIGNLSSPGRSITSKRRRIEGLVGTIH